MEENNLRALDLQHHDLYCDLNFDIHENIQTFTFWPTSLIIKARGGLLSLNSRSFIQKFDEIC